MGNYYKVLGQVNPSTTTNTTLYQVPSFSTAVISSVTICNQGVTGTCRIAIRPGNEAINTKHYILYNATVTGTESKFLKLGMGLQSTDVITVYASNGNFSFSAFGTEIE